MAATRLRAKALEVAAELLQTATDKLAIEDGGSSSGTRRKAPR